IAGTQREYLLREQLAAIQRELAGSEGGEGTAGTDAEQLRKALESAGLPAEARKDADRELARLGRIPEMSPEYTVIRNYLDWLTSFPWRRTSGGAIDLGRAE